MLNIIFYTLKPTIPRRLQIFLRQRLVAYTRKRYAHVWPVDPASMRSPEGWIGWPEGKQFALVLSHDVDTRKGYDNVLKLAKTEEDLGFRSTFNFVPERYGNVSLDLLNELKQRGFGVSVHGLKHDGKLFFSRRIFEKRAKRINCYLEKWKTRGFTSPSMHHNLKWFASLNIDYSLSTFDTDPFEPQPDGVDTIFPFWVQNGHSGTGFLELPYTLPQDHLLYVILKEQSPDIWLRKLARIAEHGGMALLNTHTDYMNFSGERCGTEQYPVRYYEDFLRHVRSEYTDDYWLALPADIVQAWQSLHAGCVI